MAEGNVHPSQTQESECNIWQPRDSTGGRKVRPRRENDEVPHTGPHDGPFSHPVYKQLSLANGLVNKMTKEQLKNKLAELKLDTRGHKDVLKKRLKNFYKDTKLVQAKVRKRSMPFYEYYLVIDFEATCDQYNPEGFRHEIIEFPAVLINAQTVQIEDQFHEYVRPVINPKLSEFCTNLTGIQQSQVDQADNFETVLRRMEKWMDSHGLVRSKNFALVTDGPWDMSRFMFLQCQWSRILFPAWAKRWVNLRKAFCNFYRIRRAKLITMLEYLGMDFEGHQHSGLDDTRNIARIVMRLISDGAELKLNEELFQDKREKNRSHVLSRGSAKAKSLVAYSEDSCEDDSDAHDRVKVLTTGLGLDGDDLSFTHTDSDVCETCKLSTEGHPSNDNVSVERVIEGLSVINLSERHMDLCQCGEPEKDTADDLLLYYALQKA